MSNPLSHKELVAHMRAAIANAGEIPLAKFCQQSGIHETEMAAVMAGQRMASALFVARFAQAFGLDWAGLWLRYSSWLWIAANKGLFASAELKHDAGKRHEAIRAAQEVARANPHMPPHILANDIEDKTGLNKAEARAIIENARQTMTGDCR